MPSSTSNFNAITASGAISSGSTINALNGRSTLRDNSYENSYTAANSNLAINYVGYQAGTTYYRDLNIYDGKGSQLFACYSAASGSYNISNQQFRAPSFYDSDNTSYYCDPNGTSVLHGLQIDGGQQITFTDAGTSTSSKSGIYGTVGNNDQFFFGGWQTASNSGVIEIASGDDAQSAPSGTAENIIVSQYGPGNALTGTLYSRIFLATGYGNHTFPNNLGIGFNKTAAPYSTTEPSYLLHVNGTGYASSDFRAPIFYDSDNTAYYDNPNGTSQFNTINSSGGVGFKNDGTGVGWGGSAYPGGFVSHIYDNGNVHYWTDDQTNFESGASGSGATWYWNGGANSTSVVAHHTCHSFQIT